ncbi:hypothetical protein [Acinetobacter sp. GSS19]|uniref:hypothetical protein n=1 Tax=Acinetobacter sp. GSS19 TaxID=3020716 RepID=UPI00235F0CB7|nr:hypothetical protein [Acinetobacter sp. GSS19]
MLRCRSLVALAAESVRPENRGRAVGLINSCGYASGCIILSYIASLDFGTNWKNIFYLGGLWPLALVVPH